MDRGAAIRVRAAIEATLREQGSYPSHAGPLVDAEARFRTAIQELAGDDRALVTEFAALFPTTPSGATAGGMARQDRFDGAGGTKDARTHLTAMSNWLQGLVDATGNSRPS